MADGTPPKKVGSLKDRIAQFEQQKPPPVPSAPRPPPKTPTQWAFKQRQSDAPSLAPSVKSFDQSIASSSSGDAETPDPPTPEKKASGMSTTDAKASIAQSGSLKDRMAALQNKGAFGAPAAPPVLPPPESKPRVWKKPIIPVSDTAESGVPIQMLAPSHDPETHDSPEEAPHAEPSQEPQPEEEEERQRRAAIAARMARLGGARVGMGPPVFAKPAILRRDTAEKAAEEKQTEDPKISESQPDPRKNPPASIRRDSREGKEDLELSDQHDSEAEGEVEDQEVVAELNSPSPPRAASIDNEPHEPLEDSHSRPTTPLDRPPSPPRQVQLMRSMSTASQGGGGEDPEASDEEKPPVPPKDDNDELTIGHSGKPASVRRGSKQEQGFRQSPTSEGIPTGTLNDDDAQRELGIRVIQGEGRPEFKPTPDNDTKSTSIIGDQPQESLAPPLSHETASRPTSASMPLPVVPKRAGPPRKKKPVKSVASEVLPELHGASMEHPEEANTTAVQAFPTDSEGPPAVSHEEVEQGEKDNSFTGARVLDTGVSAQPNLAVLAQNTPVLAQTRPLGSESSPTSDLGVKPTISVPLELHKDTTHEGHAAPDTEDLVESGNLEFKKDVSESATPPKKLKVGMKSRTHSPPASSNPIEAVKGKRTKRTKPTERPSVDLGEDSKLLLPVDSAETPSSRMHNEPSIADVVSVHRSGTSGGRAPEFNSPEMAGPLYLPGEDITFPAELEPGLGKTEFGHDEPPGVTIPRSPNWKRTGRKPSLEAGLADHESRLEYSRKNFSSQDEATALNSLSWRLTEQTVAPPVPPTATRPARRNLPPPLQPLRTTEPKQPDSYLSPVVPPPSALSHRSPMRSLPPPPPPLKSDEDFYEIQQHSFATRAPSPPPIHISGDTGDIVRTSVEFYHGKEYMDEGDTDPIDPSFYSPARSTISLPSPPQESYSASLPQDEIETQVEEVTAEEVEFARRRELADRMARLGGMKFGGSAPPARKAPVPPTEQVQTTEDEVEEFQDDVTEDSVRERRAAIAARLAAGGGRKLGLFPGASPPPMSPSRALPRPYHEDQVQDGFEHSLEPLYEGSPLHSPLILLDDHEGHDAEESQYKPPEVDDVPPPLPPGRPSSLSRPSRLPPPPPPPEKDPPMAGWPNTDGWGVSQEVTVRPNVSTSPRSPRPSRPPPVPTPEHYVQIHHPSIIQTLQESMDMSAPWGSGHPAEELPPPETAHLIAQAAIALQEQSKTTVIGDGTPGGFVNLVLKRVPSVAPVSIHTGQLGHLIYSQDAQNVTLRASEILPGDIMALTNVRFKGTKSNFQRYETSIDTQGGPLLAIVHDVDQKRQKLRAMHPCLTKDVRPFIEIASYRLEDLKTGTVQIYRAAKSRTSF